MSKPRSSMTVASGHPLDGTPPTRAATASWRDYYELCKPRICALIVFTALIGMFLAVPDRVPLHALVFGTLGIALGAASAAAFNQIIDQRIDAMMRRTRQRPLPTGHVTERQAVVFAVVLGIASMLILFFLINVLTALLTLGSLIGYSMVYTVWLKRATPQNIVIGAAPGAAPPALGWAAATGHVGTDALLLFLIIFIWTPPHFWPLAIHCREDYARTHIPMLPITHGVAYTALQILFYTVLLLPVSILPVLTGMSGVIYLVGALLLGGVFLYYAVALKRAPHDQRLPMRTFGYSIIYLTGLFAFLLIDHYLSPLLATI